MSEQGTGRHEFSWGAGDRALASLIRFDAAYRIGAACCQDPRILVLESDLVVGATIGEALNPEIGDAVRRSVAQLTGMCGEAYSQVGIQAGESARPIVWDMVVFRLGEDAFTLVIRDVTGFVEGQLKEQAYVRRLRDLAQKLESVADEERRIIAVELHDRVSQPLAAARMRLQQHQQAYLAADPEDLEVQHDHIMHLLEAAIAESRAITSELSPSIYYELGLCPALHWLADEFDRRYGTACRVECSLPADLDVDPGISAFIYRSARELISNVVRHAAASEALVVLASEDGWIRLKVRDHGRGFTVAEDVEADAHSGGFGLFSIREHVRRLGGDITVESEPGRGTLVVVEVPL